MPGIIEKSNNGLFDNEIEFLGEYANMARFLKDEVKIFNTFREVYVISAIIGRIHCQKTLDEIGDKKISASIFPNELCKRKSDLRFIYRLIMLLEDDGTHKSTIDECKERTFRDDPDDPKSCLSEKMSIFNSYVCGGLQYIYDKFSYDAGIKTRKEVIDILYYFINQIACELKLIDNSEDVSDVSLKFK